MKKRLTSDQRIDLAIRLWGCFTVLMIIGLTLGALAAATEEKIVPLILLAICWLIGIAFAFVSMKIRYHEEKPKLS